MDTAAQTHQEGALAQGVRSIGKGCSVLDGSAECDDDIDEAAVGKSSDRISQPAAETGCVVVTSPGTVNMAAIASLARALKRPIGVLAKSIYQSPSVLLDDVSTKHLDALLQPCRQLGLEVEAQSQGYEPPDDRQRFDLAVHVVNPAVILETVETVSQIVGVPINEAYKILSTPPGLLLGELSADSAAALSRRFAEGVSVNISPSDEGPYDIFVSPDTPRTPALRQLCGSSTGLVSLGLDREQAERQFARLPRGSTRLIARDLIPFDVIVTGVAAAAKPPAAESAAAQIAPPTTAVAWLSERFGIEADLLPALFMSTPIALAEGLGAADAQQLAAEGCDVGLDLTIEPAGFGRYAITVVDSTNPSAMNDVLAGFDLAIPSRLPAIVETGLSDLDARWLAFLLQAAGCQILFEESDVTAQVRTTATTPTANGGTTS